MPRLESLGSYAPRDVRKFGPVVDFLIKPQETYTELWDAVSSKLRTKSPVWFHHELKSTVKKTANATVQWFVVLRYSFYRITILGCMEFFVASYALALCLAK